ncbi:MAG: hypothetical protein K2H86_06070 [Muribaculaceae bacterium]|nr:hypothetical protein [Muribaculaceae bacterium]
MKFDNRITKAIGEWLQTNADKRDLEAGALLLLKITSNQLQYANICRRRDMATLEYQLQKHYNFRVADLTEEQLVGMVAESDRVMSKVGITENPESAEKPSESASDSIRRGRRPDHKSLPADIQHLYKDTLEYRHQMQQLHLEIRTLLKKKTPCTASDVYAFVTELLKVEKKYNAAWQKYDEYQVSK